MDMFEKYKDYVIFTSLKNELSVSYFMYNGNYIAIYTNRPDKLGFAFEPRFLYGNCETDKIIGQLVVFFDQNLFEKRYDFNSYNDGDFILKSHPMYIEGVSNSFFELCNYEVHIYHYPHEIVNINNKKSLDFFSFVGMDEDIVRELLYGIKKIISRYNHSKGIFSIHGAALRSNKKGYLFLSGSRAGKSTLFVNLIFDGFAPINDDIVFWAKNNNNEIIINGCATLPQLRENTFKKVVPVQTLRKYTIDNHDLRNEILSKYTEEYSEDSVLQAIFVPEFGYDKSSVNEISNADIFRTELRACMVHGNYEVDECFLDSIKRLNSLPTFKFCMSNNYDEVCHTFNSYLEKSHW